MATPSPIPVKVTQTTTAAYKGAGKPQPIVLVDGLPAATTTVSGSVKKASTVANPTGGATVDAEARAQLTLLLTNLRSAGIIV